MFLGFGILFAQPPNSAVIRGSVKSGGEPLAFATIYLKGTTTGTSSDGEGRFMLHVSPGKHILCVSYIGYETYETEISVKPDERKIIHVELNENSVSLGEVVVSSSAVQRVNESAYNVVAVDARALHNTTSDLAQAMSRVSGVRVRESGGVGSSVQFSLNGFSGRHIKFFINGVPMEGMGSSFQINNIPVNMAERIEIYKGVVPVGFGGDAIGGAVNIVTNGNHRRRTFADVSYSYGSYNTHRTTINAGHTSKKGLMFEISAFQNYSDNNYWIETPVKNLQTGVIDNDNYERIRRFNDTYHNETVIGKIGLVNKPFADRLIFSVNVGQTYQDVQNGVIQKIVFGEKHNTSKTFMPSFVYSKRNLFTHGLNVSLTANYNNNLRHNVDTAHYEYNWFGERKAHSENSRGGEQSYQDSEFENRNWNTTFNLSYRLNDLHSVVLNNVLSSFDRNTRATSQDMSVIATDTMPKVSMKNVLGLSYMLNYNDKWNVSVFGKHYMLYAKGPRLTSTESNSYELYDETFTTSGYGIAGTYFLRDVQIKLSYEKAYRLPTDSELFGDEDMEAGTTGLKPENSDNYNINLSYEKDLDKMHFFYFDGGFILRNTKDYIRRNTFIRSGGINYASHFNHGYVQNIGLNAEVRYSFKDLLSAGVSVTSQNIRDREKIAAQTTRESKFYGVRLPNVPYFFANSDINLFWRDFIKKGNMLTLTYNNNYVHEFPLRWENEGIRSSKDIVPTQFSHDILVSYTMQRGRYNISFECKNLTDAKMFDNFSLQKPGRGFYGKVRYHFSK